MEFGTAAATAPVAAYFRNPRRSTDVLSSAIGTPPRSLQFSISPRTSVLASWMADILHPAGSAEHLVFQSRYFKTPSSSAFRSITMGEILWLVVGIRAAKGLSHESSHSSDAYAYVVVIRGRDDVVRGNCVRTGFAWRSAH